MRSDNRWTMSSTSPRLRASATILGTCAKWQSLLANQGIPAEGRRVIVDDLVRRLDSVAFKFQCDDNIPHELASAAFHEAVGAVTAVIVQLEIELWYSKQNAK